MIPDVPAHMNLCVPPSCFYNHASYGISVGIQETMKRRAFPTSSLSPSLFDPGH